MLILSMTELMLAKCDQDFRLPRSGANVLLRFRIDYLVPDSNRNERNEWLCFQQANE